MLCQSPLCARWLQNPYTQPITGREIDPATAELLSTLCGQPLTQPTIVSPTNGARNVEPPLRRRSFSGYVITSFAPQPAQEQVVDIKTQEELKNVLAQASRYEAKEFPLLRRLGAGAFGEVFLSMSPDGGNLVIKRINKQRLAQSGLGPEAVNSEVAILANLASQCDPYILCYLNFLEDDENYYILTEYLGSHQNLFDLVRNRDLTTEEKTKIMNEMMAGLTQIHQAQVAHRDIKPENTLINLQTLDTDQPSTKIIDYGLACRGLQCNNQRPSGTLLYMAPEVVRNGGHPTNLRSLQQTDIWSLGMTDYYLLTGEDYYDRWYRAFLSLHPEVNPNDERARNATLQAEIGRGYVNLDMFLPPFFAETYPRQYASMAAKLRVNPEERQLIPV